MTNELMNIAVFRGRSSWRRLPPMAVTLRHTVDANGVHEYIVQEWCKNGTTWEKYGLPVPSFFPEFGNMNYGEAMGGLAADYEKVSFMFRTKEGRACHLFYKILGKKGIPA